MPDETREELARLASAYALVACVSGRPGAEVERMLGVEGVAIVGEHGLELAPEAARLGGVASRRSPRGVDWPAERKPLSVSFHFRRADDEAAARAYLDAGRRRCRRAQGLVPRWGRMVLEVRPPVAADKGTAVRALVARAGVAAALYAGDDTTDLDAFAASTASRSRCASPSTRARRRRRCCEAADVVVDGTDGVLELLRSL